MEWMAIALFCLRVRGATCRIPGSINPGRNVLGFCRHWFCDKYV